jgi:hypothetical protein
MNHSTPVVQSVNNNNPDLRRVRRVLEDISPRIRKINPPNTEKRGTTRPKKPKAS